MKICLAFMIEQESMMTFECKKIVKIAHEINEIFEEIRLVKYWKLF